MVIAYSYPSLFPIHLLADAVDKRFQLAYNLLNK
jgi:hypothetical protein